MFGVSVGWEMALLDFTEGECIGLCKGIIFCRWRALLILG